MLKRLLIILSIFFCIISYAQVTTAAYDSLIRYNYKYAYEEVKPQNFDSIVLIDDARLPSIDSLLMLQNLKGIIYWGQEFTAGKEWNRLDKLQLLDISQTYKVDFSKDIQSFPKLQVLKFSDFNKCSLRKLPEFVYNSKELQHIYVWIKTKKAIDYKRFVSSLGKLKYLELVCHSMYRLPKEITTMQGLEQLLILGPTKFKLDEAVLKMDSLKHLYIPCPLNENVINIVSKMPNLKGLTLTGGIDLKDYESIKKIGHLKYLTIYHVKLPGRNLDKYYNEVRKFDVEVGKIMSLIPDVQNGPYPSKYEESLYHLRK